jgi:hypothetical protein
MLCCEGSGSCTLKEECRVSYLKQDLIWIEKVADDVMIREQATVMRQKQNSESKWQPTMLLIWFS